MVHHLTAADSLVLFIFIAFTVGMGLALRPSMKTSRDFLEAGRAMPAWLCGLAFMAVSLGAPEVIGMSALGARYGFEAAQFYGIGAIPAMLFLGVFMMPVYYSSKARTVPEYLGLRFDAKTRVLNACLFLAMAVLISGLSLYALGRVMQALRLFDGMAVFARWTNGAFVVPAVIAAGLVLAYVMLGGLAGAMYNQVMQFFLIVAGLSPVVFLGLKNGGGWSGFKQSIAGVDPALLHEWRGVAHTGANPMGIETIGLIVGLGAVLGGGYLCTHFAVLQPAMAAQSMDAARKAPLIAAIPKLLFPFLVVVPGLLAVGLPTPHTKTTITINADGSIMHSIDVVSPAAEQGKGIVPAQVDGKTGRPSLDASGKPVIDYDAALPNLLLHWLPTGMLGLGLTAILASFMSGLAANIAAINAVFTRDVYQAHLHKGASDRHLLVTGRWATVGGMVLALAAALAFSRVHEVFTAALLIVCLGGAPLLATVLLGMFWKRATGHGAFWGLLAGTAAALVNFGLTVPAGAKAGIHGGWIRAVQLYASRMEQLFWGAIFAFAANLLVCGLVSLATRPAADAALDGLLYPAKGLQGTPRTAWWKRPEGLAAAILLAAIAVNIFLA